MKIYDNWPVFIYGNKDELFSKVTQAFRNPLEEGIKDSWHYVNDVIEEGGRITQLFDYGPGTVRVQVTRVYHGMWRKEDKINGLDPSVMVIFHPYQEKKMKNVHWVKAMALAIIGLGEYILKENLTARFPKDGLDLNYIPK